jgi:2-polyprenyl-3-methyl-5-hydroxy-6-metoxy-1,4-benzoquinol methylase
LYASVTDYTAVYNEGYRDRRGSQTSFDIRVLPTLLASFCREVGVSALLDVSGGQGRLADALGGLGIGVLTTDLAAAPGRPIIAFDLSRYSEADIARVRQEAERTFGGAPHVTSCLDVLEHIDREHVFAAVRNLASLTARLLVVSISTRPSSRDNLFHASIFPVST